ARCGFLLALGVDCKVLESHLPALIVSPSCYWKCSALLAWESLKAGTATCCKSMVIVHNGICLNLNWDVRKKEKRIVLSESYVANLSLYPGRSKLPFSLQVEYYTTIYVVGILIKEFTVIGGNTISGFRFSGQGRCDIGKMFYWFI
ncbi:hypothetical protein HID58_075208, partial [Brassica napus]